MLRFTKKADYGLMAIHYIAAQADEEAVSAKRIAEEFKIPPELLAKILQRLAKRKLIVSHNGPKGGYLLGRDPNQITVGQVIRALEGPVEIVGCVTAVDSRVLDAMIPYFTEKFGHPASRNHPFGWEAEAGLDRAREQIARLIGARDPKDLVFTSRRP